MDVTAGTNYFFVIVVINCCEYIKAGLTRNVFDMGLVFAAFTGKHDFCFWRNPNNCWLVHAIKNAFTTKAFPWIAFGLRP
jgi:hypothetical protein